MLLLILILCPIVLSLLTLAVRKILLMEIMAAVMGVTEFILSVWIALRVASDGVYSLLPYFSVDAVGAVILSSVAVVGLASSIYSIGYLRQEVLKGIIGFRRVRQYFALLGLFLAVMFFAISTTSPIMMWIGIEATTLATAFLISFYNKPSAIEAAWKYLIINSIGLLLAFFGTLLFFTSLGNAGFLGLVNWGTLLSGSSGLNPMIAKIAFIFAFIGYGTKVGLAPMHTWLPDAHSKAPSPISALLSGALLNVALLAILRFKIVTDSVVGPDFSQNLLIFFGILSMVVAAFIIFVQKNFKRLLAYSSIEHMGIAAVGFGFGGIGTFAALLHLLYHSLAKSLLFLTAGNIFLKYSSTKIAKVKGLLSSMPVTGVVFIAGFLAITGVPPFGIFVTEFFILSAGFASHTVSSIVMLAALALIFAGFLRHVSQMVFGEKPENVLKGEISRLASMTPLAVMVALAVLSVYIPGPLKELLVSAASLIQ